MTEVFPGTELVLIVKLIEVAPAGTVVNDGTVATEVLLLARVTMAPPEGAGAVRVTVPVAEVPPSTAVGFKVNVESAGGLTVKVAVFVTPALDAVILRAMHDLPTERYHQPCEFWEAIALALTTNARGSEKISRATASGR